MNERRKLFDELMDRLDAMRRERGGEHFDCRRVELGTEEDAVDAAPPSERE